MFSRRAMAAIGATLTPYGEFLPIDYEGGDYHAYNVTHVVDALNVPESELYFFDDGSLLDIFTYVFYPGALADQIIFKLPQLQHRYVYVTERFVALCVNIGETSDPVEMSVQA